MGDFNINLLNYNIDKNTSDFVGILYSHALFPTINSPTQISPYSKTLIPYLITYFIVINADGKRSFRNINSMAFEEDLKWVNWNEALTLSEENPNSLFKAAFLNIVVRLIDKHCAKKPIPKTKHETKSKPWIAPTLSNSIKIKNRIYKKFCKASALIKKRKLHGQFKNYRNLTTTLTTVCKEEHYKSSFQDNKKDFKKYGKA